MKNLILVTLLTILVSSVKAANEITIEGPLNCQVWGPGKERRSAYYIHLKTDNVSHGCETLTLSTIVDSETGGTIFFPYANQVAQSNTICLSETNCVIKCPDLAFSIDGGINYFYNYDPVTNTRSYYVEVEWNEPHPTEIGGKLYAIYKESGSLSLTTETKTEEGKVKTKIKLDFVADAKAYIVTPLYPRKTREIKVTPLNCTSVRLSTKLVGDPDNVAYPISCDVTGYLENGIIVYRYVQIKFEWQRLTANGWAAYATTNEPVTSFNANNPDQLNTFRVRNVVHLWLNNQQFIISYSEWSVVTFRTSNKPSSITGDQYIAEGESLEQLYSLDATPTTANWSVIPFYNSANIPQITPGPGSAYVFFPATPAEELYTINVSGSSNCGGYQLQYYVVVEAAEGSGNNNLTSNGNKKDVENYDRTADSEDAEGIPVKIPFEKPSIFFRGETIQVQMYNEHFSGEIMVADVNGRILYLSKTNNTQTDINTTEMPSGVYFVSVTCSAGRWTEKVSVFR